jgi:mannose/fructose/N-acetylgalactosamine-specific phosphotransferase system component IIB
VSVHSIIIRIDDRLIHGQVLIGWGSRYPIKNLVVANNNIAVNEWEKNLLLMAAPPEFDTRVLNLNEALVYIKEHQNDPVTSMILVNSPADIKEMADNGLPVKKINIGGIHFNEGRAEYLRYLYLNEEEVTIFRELIRQGFTFECQDVPAGSKYDLAKILENRS